MLSFTPDAVGSLRAVMDMAPPPVAGLRIASAVSHDEWDATAPVLQLAAVATVDFDDELVITEDGIPVFIEPAIAPFLEGTVLDAAPDQWSAPTFLLEYDLPFGGAALGGTARSGAHPPRARWTADRWRRR